VIRMRIQHGGVNLDVSASGKPIWVFRWRETRLDGRRAQRKKVIGTFEEYPTKKQAENAARGFRLDLVDQGPAKPVRITMQELVRHFREHELTVDEDGRRAYSTCVRYRSVLKRWILPRWRKTPIDQIRTIAIEEWLGSIERANGTKSKIRNTLSTLYNHAIRWEFIGRNPVTGPVRGSGVRQSAKRKHIPDLLEVEEFQRLQAELKVRERILVWLAMTSGLRRGELAGLRWCDVSFEKLTILAQRSVVDQVAGPVKTEASERPIPVDPSIAEDLLTWYRMARYTQPNDYVFATDAARAGKRRGRQPIWLSKVMSYYIQPAAQRVGITKNIGWHTFRRTYTSLLHANHEDVKVVQELLRHGSAKVTLDVYAQALTPAKRKAQGKVVSILRSNHDPAV